MIDARITLKVNMQKASTPEVREQMHVAGIVPRHLLVDWLHLTIFPHQWAKLNNYQRYVLRAERTAHGSPDPSILVKPQELIDVFQLLFVQPNLPSEAYMQLVKILKPMALTLSKSSDWVTYVKTTYPKYFKD